MSTYALLPKDPERLVPAGIGVLPLFFKAELALAYRATHGWLKNCEVAELPALEVLRAMLQARKQGIARVTIDPTDGGGPNSRKELGLEDPWGAFVELLHCEQKAMVEARPGAVSEDGFSDPRLHHERPQTLAPSADPLSEHDSVVVDLTAAQLLTQAGSIELAKHALDIVADLAAELIERTDPAENQKPEDQASPP